MKLLIFFVELKNNKRHVKGKLGHFLGAPYKNIHSWRSWGSFSLRRKHSKPKWFGRCVGRLQRRLGVLEEEETTWAFAVNSILNLHIVTTSKGVQVQTFSNLKKVLTWKKGKRVSSLNFYHYNFALQKVSVDQFTPCLLDLCKVW